MWVLPLLLLFGLIVGLMVSAVLLAIGMRVNDALAEWEDRPLPQRDDLTSEQAAARNAYARRYPWKKGI